MWQALQSRRAKEWVIFHKGGAEEDQAKAAEDPGNVPGWESEAFKISAGPQRPRSHKLDYRYSVNLNTVLNSLSLLSGICHEDPTSQTILYLQQ